MTPVVLTPLARRDIEEIWDYLAAENLRVAERVFKRIEVDVRKLARTPGIGHFRENSADRRHRSFQVHSYLIVYRPSTQPLEVIHTLHASRDVHDLLGLYAEEP